MTKRSYPAPRSSPRWGRRARRREMIRALFEAGADVFRFNFSHGSHEEHQARYDIIRGDRAGDRPADRRARRSAGAEAARRHASRNGPIRARHRRNASASTSTRRPGTPRPRAAAASGGASRRSRPACSCCSTTARCGSRSRRPAPSSAVARVIVGGPLSDRKGVSVVGAVLPVSALTEKDRARPRLRARSWASTGSRCRSCSGRRTWTRCARSPGGPCRLVAKLEKPAAVERLDEIVARSDAVMVARGDLGVEMAPQQVPTIQRQIIRACRAAGKPVIVATQMLESMIEAPTPTRAEASDVATAVYEGADAVMLSAESAAGKYPVEAVRMMDKHHRRGRGRPALPQGHRRGAPRARGHHIRRDLLRRAAGGGDPAGGRDRDLHHLRLDHAARSARAPGGPDPGPDARSRDSAPTEPGVGHLSGPDAQRPSMWRRSSTTPALPWRPMAWPSRAASSRSPPGCRSVSPVRRRTFCGSSACRGDRPDLGRPPAMVWRVFARNSARQACAHAYR